MTKKLTKKKELLIYRDYLLLLGTAVWTGNSVRAQELLTNLSDYCFKRTQTASQSEEGLEDIEEAIENLTK